MMGYLEPFVSHTYTYQKVHHCPTNPNTDLKQEDEVSLALTQCLCQTALCALCCTHYTGPNLHANTALHHRFMFSFFQKKKKKMPQNHPLKSQIWPSTWMHEHKHAHKNPDLNENHIGLLKYIMHEII